MRRLWIALLMASLLAVGLSSAALAKSTKDCSGSWQPVHLNLDYDGNGAPAPGVDEWWDMTLAGIAADGIAMEDLFATFGVADIDGFYELVLYGILTLDSNGNGVVCARPFPPQQNGKPLYYFHAVEDKAG